MSPSRKKARGTKSRRTKEQILQELEITQRLLIEKEEELVLCQEELANQLQRNESAALLETDVLADIDPEQVNFWKQEIDELKTMLASTKKEKEKAGKARDSANASLKSANANLEAKEAEVNELKSNAANLAASIEELKAKEEGVTNKIDALRKDLVDQKKLEKNLKAAQKRIKELETQLSKKEKQLADAVAKSADTSSEENLSLTLEAKPKVSVEIVSSKVTVGKAKAISSEEARKLFEQARNQESVTASAAIKIPYKVESEIKVRSEPAVEEAEVVSIETPPPAISEDAQSIVSTESVTTTTKRPKVPIRIAPFANIIQQNEPFSASILVNMAELSNTEHSLTCNTRLFAKRLTDGWSSLIGQKSTTHSSTESFEARLDNLVLPTGLYHLQVVASFSSIDGQPIPIAAIHEGEVLEVS